MYNIIWARKSGFRSHGDLGALFSSRDLCSNQIGDQGGLAELFYDDPHLQNVVDWKPVDIFRANNESSLRFILSVFLKVVNENYCMDQLIYGSK